MTRDEFIEAVAIVSMSLDITSVMAEYDRLTALNAQQQKALKAARRYIIENGALMVEPALMEVQAAIRAAEESK